MNEVNMAPDDFREGILGVASGVACEQFQSVSLMFRKINSPAAEIGKVYLDLHDPAGSKCPKFSNPNTQTVEEPSNLHLVSARLHFRCCLDECLRVFHFLENSLHFKSDRLFPKRAQCGHPKHQSYSAQPACFCLLHHPLDHLRGIQQIGLQALAAEQRAVSENSD